MYYGHQSLGLVLVYSGKNSSVPMVRVDSTRIVTLSLMLY